MSASRSTTWTINNATESDFNLVSANLAHGVWASNPPQMIKSGQSVTFKAESDGIATGTEGTIIYSIPAGQYSFYFDNPFIGADSYKVTCPNGYDNSTTQTTGNDQVLVTRCFKD